MIDLDQDVFMTQYVTAFLANWAANQYDKANADTEVMPLTKPPIMHAISLARVAWCELMAYGCCLRR
jgi:hypothetical protein